MASIFNNKIHSYHNILDIDLLFKCLDLFIKKGFKI